MYPEPIPDPKPDFGARRQGLQPNHQEPLPLAQNQTPHESPFELLGHLADSGPLVKSHVAPNNSGHTQADIHRWQPPADLTWLCEQVTEHLPQLRLCMTSRHGLADLIGLRASWSSAPRWKHPSTSTPRVSPTVAVEKSIPSSSVRSRRDAHLGPSLRSWQLYWQSGATFEDRVPIQRRQAVLLEQPHVLTLLGRVNEGERRLGFHRVVEFS